MAKQITQVNQIKRKRGKPSKYQEPVVIDRQKFESLRKVASRHFEMLRRRRGGRRSVSAAELGRLLEAAIAGTRVDEMDGSSPLVYEKIGMPSPQTVANWVNEFVGNSPEVEETSWTPWREPGGLALDTPEETAFLLALDRTSRLMIGRPLWPRDVAWAKKLRVSLHGLNELMQWLLVVLYSVRARLAELQRKKQPETRDLDDWLAFAPRFGVAKYHGLVWAGYATAPPTSAAVRADVRTVAGGDWGWAGVIDGLLLGMNVFRKKEPVPSPEETAKIWEALRNSLSAMPGTEDERKARLDEWDELTMGREGGRRGVSVMGEGFTDVGRKPYPPAGKTIRQGTTGEVPLPAVTPDPPPPDDPLSSLLLQEQIVRWPDIRVESVIFGDRSRRNEEKLEAHLQGLSHARTEEGDGDGEEERER